ncbi:hypothetical protein MM236_02065 [Belliella sp. DSM 107340]|uniref:PNPLA domain-containing protein n=1 Tax=Belliella calami TaxID=2923436 RepID=A0ABS9UJF5_9BACT|nr:hypothetical protein [Belliella calami]
MLERNQVPVDLVVGSSLGSMVVAFWAGGYAEKEGEK